MEDLQNLPPEYQAEIEAAQRKRALAQLLQKQAMGFQGAQQTGRIAPKTSPLAWLANAATGYMGTQADTAGAKSIADTRNRAGVAQRAEIAALMAAPEDQQFAQGQQGKFSQTQALAKAMQDQRMKLREKRGDILGRNEMPDQALAALEGKPVGPLPQPTPPQWGTQPGPNGPIQTVTNFGKGGRMTGGFGPGAGTTVNNIPAQTEKAALIAGAGEVPKIGKDTMTGMQSAVDMRDKADRILSLAKDPEVITGFAAEPQLFLTNMAAKLNLTGPDAAAKTQSLLSGIAEQTLDASLDLKGAITEKEWPRLAQARAGEISYTPAALQELAHVARAKAHNQYIRALHQRQAAGNFPGGSDVLAMYPPSAYGSAEFPKDLYSERQDGTIRYTGSINAILGKAPAGPAAASRPAGWENLTPAQQQRYEQLKKGLGK